MPARNGSRRASQRGSCQTKYAPRNRSRKITLASANTNAYNGLLRSDLAADIRHLIARGVVAPSDRRTGQ